MSRFSSRIGETSQCPAAIDPDVAGPQTIPQLDEHLNFPDAEVDLAAARPDTSSPFTRKQGKWHVRGQFASTEGTQMIHLRQ